jgi:hypothetical protein
MAGNIAEAGSLLSSMRSTACAGASEARVLWPQRSLAELAAEDEWLAAISSAGVFLYAIPLGLLKPIT